MQYNSCVRFEEMKNLTVSVFLLLASFCICAKLPSSFKKCNRKESDFNECLKVAVEDAIRQLNRPRKQIGLVSLEPLVVPSLTIEPGHGVVSFLQNFKNFKFFGLSKINVTKLELNFKTKTFFMESFFPEIKYEYDYDFNGTILSMPIHGIGSGVTIMDKAMYNLTFTLEEYLKKGKKYFTVADTKLVIETELIKFKLDNLFDGDKALGDNINKAINDNWSIIWIDVKPNYENGFGQIFSTLFKSLLANVPISELFGTE